MKHQYFRYITAGLAIALLAGFYWLIKGTADDNTAFKRLDSESGLLWHEGKSQQYQLLYDSVMRLNTGGSSQSMDLHLEARLNTHTLSTSNSETEVGMQLSSVALRISGQSDPSTNRQLETPFRVFFAANGQPVRFEFPADISLEYRRIVENTLRTFQLSLQPEENWTSAETNSSGSYQAQYERLSSSELTKSKTNFVQSPQSAILQGAQISSSETIRLSPQADWIDQMIIDEQLTSANNAAFDIDTRNFAKLTWVTDSQPVPNAEVWRFTAAEAASDTAQQKAELPEMSAEQARQEILNRLPILNEATQGRLSLVHQLSDLLQVDPSLPALLIEQIQSGDLTDRTQADLYLALELAATEAAQTALTGVITNPDLEIKNNLRAIVAISGMTSPSPATLDALWQTAQQVERSRLKSTATYALGTLAGNMREANHDEYRQVTQDLLSGTTGSSNTLSRMYFVQALGNTRDPELAYEVVAMLDDQEASIRRAAAQSLVNLGIDENASYLVEQFNRESNSRVRGSIAESLVQWTAPTQEANNSIRRAITNETDENARLQMARFLSSNLDQYPDNTELLRKLLRSESSKRIRQEIANALANAQGISGRSQ